MEIKWCDGKDPEIGVWGSGFWENSVTNDFNEPEKNAYL